MTDTAVADLAGRLGVTFRDPGLLARALVHRSWAFEHKAVSNERLEFLGDAVLELVVTDELFHLCPQAEEGRLADLRSATVSALSLAAVARDLGLGSDLFLGVGEAASGGADKESLLADALEAVLGAVYLDAGFDTAYRVTQRLFAARLADVVARSTVVDPKTTLQEHVVPRTGQPPRYHSTTSGPDHAPTFTTTVEVAGEVVGRGHAGSKKAAERAAAVMALIALTGVEEEHTPPPPPASLAGTLGHGTQPEPIDPGAIDE